MESRRVPKIGPEGQAQGGSIPTPKKFPDGTVMAQLGAIPGVGGGHFLKLPGKSGWRGVRKPEFLKI